ISQLFKACLLTIDPNYPESTTVLAHGVTTRKRKKQGYQFLEDEVKIQKNGLFTHVAEQQKQLGSLGLQNSLQSIIYVLSVAIITPVKEEILFRGILYRFLEKKYNFLVGIIISSFIFGILHGGLLITATIMGIVFAMLYKKTQSIIPSIILHIVWNLLVSISMIVSL
ncbi:YaaC family protein, partial [Bacillus toyonensis]|uniref:YaaC family protein n=1 Tax=Bacillus toyonensis TaxID=155322 RepID=UPI002FFF8EC6